MSQPVHSAANCSNGRQQDPPKVEQHGLLEKAKVSSDLLFTLLVSPQVCNSFRVKFAQTVRPVCRRGS